jgi:predicted sugar kinase
MKTNFKKFPVGTVFNPYSKTLKATPKYKKIVIRYPSRLEAMALDPSKITSNNNLVYKAGQIDFCVGIYKTVTIEIVKDGKKNIHIDATSSRKPLILHACIIMRKALNFSDSLNVKVETDLDLRHCGLGSSSATIASVATAINEIYDLPMSPIDISRYCAQNHGEEIKKDHNNLTPVQCLGGSAVCGNFVGGLIVLAGEATPIATVSLPKEYHVVIGVPKNFTHPDSELLLKKEEENMDGFSRTGKIYSKTIAYRMLHDVLPDLAFGNLEKAKNLIFDYRWKMGSIKNCSFVYPPMNDIASKLQDYNTSEKFDILSLSSVGPGFFALTRDVNYVSSIFKNVGLETYDAIIHNEKYIVELKEYE